MSRDFIPDGPEKRKLDQLNTVLQRDVLPRAATTGFEKIHFEHNCLPELDFDTIDLSTKFLGKSLAAPLLISSMTGGPERAGTINATLAEVAQTLRIAFAVGSQRVALENGHVAGFDKSLRAKAPDIPILANIGAAQLREWPGMGAVLRAVEMIDADALIVHLNPLQEALQRDGDRNWSGVLARIETLVSALPCPVIVKEVGCGISARVALRLTQAGVKIIDVAGLGGTSWAAVVAEQSASDTSSGCSTRAVAQTFRDWGIPTAECLVAVRAACPHATLIASGGLRNGLDAAKAIRLGADLAGFAAAILPEAIKGTDSLVQRFETIIQELKIAAFCTGSKDLADLRLASIFK